MRAAQVDPEAWGLTPSARKMPAESLTWDQFEAVDMRVGRVVEVEDFPEARRPAWKLRIDFGPEIGERRSSAQIKNYERSDLEGRQVVAVVNFPPKQIGPFMSECLVLGAVNDDGTVILLEPDPGRRAGRPDRLAALGLRGQGLVPGLEGMRDAGCARERLP